MFSMPHMNGTNIIDNSFTLKYEEFPSCDNVCGVGGRKCTTCRVNPPANLSLESKFQHMSVMKPNPNMGFPENLKTCNPTMTMIVELVLVQLILQGC
jgi:hypothetical protein